MATHPPLDAISQKYLDELRKHHQAFLLVQQGRARRVELVEALAARGWKGTEIARFLGVTPGAVTFLRTKGRKSK
jgi:hypothetical protein